MWLSISQVTAGFQTTNMLTALPSSFLEPLLSFSLTEDPEIRLLVLQILLSLIDRHDNTPKFSNIRCVCVCMFVCIYCGAVHRWQSMLIVVSSFYAASSQTSLCSSSKSTSVPDRTTCSWKRFLNFEHMNIYVFLMSNLSDSSSILLVRSTRSMASSCIDTYTWAVRSRAAVGSTTRPSSLCWVFSAWSWPTKRWWWTSFVWHSPCRYWCS